MFAVCDRGSWNESGAYIFVVGAIPKEELNGILE
jgi:hypothetical protein